MPEARYKAGEVLIERRPKMGRGDVPVVVTKVGRRWVTYRQADRPTGLESRFDISDNRIDTNGYLGGAGLVMREDEWPAWDLLQSVIARVTKRVSFGFGGDPLGGKSVATRLAFYEELADLLDRHGIYREQ